MDIPEFVETRRKRYLALALQAFDRDIAPLIDTSQPGARDARESFKAMIRSQFQNFATDCTDGIELFDTGIQINPAAVDIKDRLQSVRGGLR